MSTPTCTCITAPEVDDSGEVLHAGYCMTVVAKPKTAERPTSLAEQIKQALSDAGAFCGECGFEPGDRGCDDCERCYTSYAKALLPIMRAAEIQRLKARVTELEKANAGLDDLRIRAIDKGDQLRAERDALQDRLHKVALAKVWTNEDGKKFVFVEDIANALYGITPETEATR